MTLHAPASAVLLIAFHLHSQRWHLRLRCLKLFVSAVEREGVVSFLVLMKWVTFQQSPLGDSSSQIGELGAAQI